MKAILNLDQFADLSTLPDNYRDKIVFRPDKHGRPEAVFPAGTAFDGDHALLLCKTGQASPGDDECAAALGRTPQQIAAMQVEYRMNALGINDKSARELYRAGVIAGYDANLGYIPGPNWDKYQAAKQAAAIEDDI